MLLDVRHLGEAVINERLSQIREIGRDFANVDLLHEPIPIRPGMHYQMGGIKTDVDGQTEIGGLYAAGEAACVSVHGGNRLGRKFAAGYAGVRQAVGRTCRGSRKVQGAHSSSVTDSSADGDRVNIQRLLDNDSNGEMFGKIRREMGDTMNEHLAVYREQNGMETALGELRGLRERFNSVSVPDKSKTFNTNLLFTLELGFMLDCAEAIALAAIERKESRGAHTRTDAPGPG